MPFDETAAFLADWGISVVWGETSFLALFDTPGMDMQLAGAAIGGTTYSIVYATKDADGLKEGETIVLQETTFRVRDVSLQDDGLFSRALLMKVASSGLDS